MNSLAPAAFAAKDPAETVWLAFDFSALAGSLALFGPVVTVAEPSGTDTNPAALLAGAPTLQGTTVLQRVQGGQAPLNYRLRAQVDATDGSRWVLVGVLPVRAG